MSEINSSNSKPSSVIVNILGAAACVAAAFILPVVINKASGKIYKRIGRRSKNIPAKRRNNHGY